MTARPEPTAAGGHANGWSMPAGAAVLVMAIIIAGVAAATTALPSLWLVTPLVAATVVGGGLTRGATAIDDLDAAPFPPPLRRTVRHASARLPRGEARTLLAAVVAQARAIIAESVGQPAPDSRRATVDNVVALTAACCATALDLAQLDDFLGARFQAATTQPPADARRAELDARARAARALFARRLTDAELALRSIYTVDVERGTTDSDRVAELVTEINADAAARRAANDELQRLLGSTSER